MKNGGKGAWRRTVSQRDKALENYQRVHPEKADLMALARRYNQEHLWVFETDMLAEALFGRSRKERP